MATERDTAFMVYRNHKYFLTDAGILDKLNVILSAELGRGQSSGVTEAKVFLNQVTRRVYTWLYAYIRRESKMIIEYWIANDYNAYGTPFRDAMEEALEAQAEYMLNFDGDMEAIDANDMTKLVSQEAKHILISAGIATRSMIQVKIPVGQYRVGY